MQWMLVPFGWLFIIFALALVFIPYLRGRGDLLTTWNLFLLGTINFLGISTIQLGYRGYSLYGLYTDYDILLFVISVMVLFAVACPTYYFFKLPRRIAANHFRSWIAQTDVSLVGMTLIALGLSLTYFFVIALPGIALIMGYIGLHASIFAMCFAAVAWAQRPANVSRIILVAITWLFAAVLTVKLFGRQEFVSVVLGMFICVYWIRLRYRRKAVVMTWLICGVVLGLVAATGITTYRFQRHDASEGFFQSGLEAIEAMPTSFNVDTLSSLLGTGISDASVGAINLYVEGDEPTKPFFAIWYVLCNPIPRALWPDKPLALGETLPVDLGYRMQIKSYINLGPGIVAHGFQEGGIHMLVFYGFLIGAFFRLADEVLVRNHNSAVVLGTFASTSGTILAFYRGDMGLYVVLFIGTLITGIIINILGRMLFGTMRFVADSGDEDAGLAEHAPANEAMVY